MLNGTTSKAPAFNHETLIISSYVIFFNSVHQNDAWNFRIEVNLQIAADKRLSEFLF